MENQEILVLEEEIKKLNIALRIANRENRKLLRKSALLESHFSIETNMFRVLAAQAEQASRSKSNFLAAMSHEIRTPLNAIIGVAEIQMQKNNLPDEYLSDMERILHSGVGLLGIINDILDMSKIETGKMELNPSEYDIQTLIHDTVQLNVVRLGSKQIKFVLDVDEHLPTKYIGDSLRIKQILNNLLSNAIKYTEKGSITLSVDFFMREGNTMLQFTVEDTGQGMKPEDVEKLFSEYSRFNTQSNKFVEGTGLGLSIAQKLARLMDGEITVESKFGKGSIFTVTVQQIGVESHPIGKEALEQLKSFNFKEKRENEKEIRNLMPHGKVLVVDDIESNLYVAQGLLLPYRLSVDIVSSGFEAIEKINNGATYDIIFMDHMMPEMDGIETTHKLRALGYKGTIVALTANALVGNDILFLQNGFDDYISKPIDMRRLNEVLNNWIAAAQE
ncbi:MAG: ATP-binding protein [Defluviitaleaceae bacterium]|nr:ATP-binding protein [Defluviitaleaceae bacterium]